MVRIFDSLAHPTLSGTWHKGIEQASFESLVKDLADADFSGACAVGLAGMHNYGHEQFASECKKYPQLIPVAGCAPTAGAAEMDLIKTLGFVGLKLHPLSWKIPISVDVLANIFIEASRRDLVVFYCTYAHGSIASYPSEDPFFTLVKALKLAPEVKLVLVHGGDIQVLRYAELARLNNNLLLDVSFTLMKYAGSSIDQDLRFLFSRFDHHICIGTDHPEFSHSAVRQRFEELTASLSITKQENLASKNILKFLGKAV